jgi:hypothetical protein
MIQTRRNVLNADALGGYSYNLFVEVPGRQSMQAFLI